MRFLVVLLVIFPGSVLAGDWVAMSGAEIGDALTDRRVAYDEAWQDFFASGRTNYNAGQDSWGSWEVRGDQYCSQWPPAVGWACYDMAWDGDASMVRFIGESGDVTDGILVAQ